jgi:adenosine kinase
MTSLSSWETKWTQKAQIPFPDETVRNAASVHATLTLFFSTMAELTGILYGQGNPLLDVSAVVEQSLLDKYNLQLNNAILAGPEHMPLYDEMVQIPGHQFIAGGATQNSIRVAQWMMQSPGATVFVGCVGNDANGQQLRDCAERDGVKVLHYISLLT